MDENEKYVTEHWERAESCPTGYSDQIRFWVISLGGRMFTKATVPDAWKAETESAAWQAAFAFTKAREEEIRQVEEEIMELQDDISCYHTGEHFYAIYGRILAREQSALAELQRGMKATR